MMFVSGRVVLGALLLGVWLGNVTLAQDQDSFADDKAAIAKAAAKYLAAIRAGDAEQIAACWTADGDFTDPSGWSQKGRTLARKAVKASREPAVETVPQVESIRLVTSDVALEDGTIEQSGSNFIRYTAVWVRRDDRWLLDGVREAEFEPQSHYDHLRPLAWMVGQWQTGDESPVRLSGSCQWSKERNFLLREIQLSNDAGQTMTVTQRIGWDPLTEQIRVWSFDNAGGHSQGIWVQNGRQWIVSTRGVTPEGSLAESRNTYTRISSDAFSVESHSTVDDEEVPDQKLRLVRKPK
jgi:uncharacterized protein (TIGR02246 family)